MQQDFEALARHALTEPGRLSEAYSAFHEYSLNNQWLALMQLGNAEPINTFNGWKSLNRHVKKGSKAIELIMPVFKKAKNEVAGKLRKPEKDDARSAVFYMPRRYWFPLSATEGQEYIQPPIPDFNPALMMSTLNITEEPFQSLSGNCMGYAKTDERIIAVSPIAFDPIKTRFHEVAHVLLHPKTFSVDEQRPQRDVREVEAELTAYLLKATLGLNDGLEMSRGYIQHWIDDETAEKVRFPKVYGAADQILKAGRAASSPSPL